MEFRTPVAIAPPPFQIAPLERILCVGSCFADHIGQRFVDHKFRATVNPYGVMYNPASILHTVRRTDEAFPVAFLTLGTNHVYRLKASGEIVDNCEKRPHQLFEEEVLTVGQCADYLREAVDLLRSRCADVQVVLTVSPIRYRKYGFHGSQLSKATLLLAADEVAQLPYVYYFPAYEIVNDELRDYRFYAADMLHPSEQAVDYIWERLCATCLSDRARQFLEEWQPVRQALGHKPFAPESEAYRTFMDKTMLKVEELRKKYGNFAL